MCNSQRSPISIALLSILLALSMACSRRPNDDQIAKDIQDKAAVDPDTKESPAQVEAKEGKVTLSGKVRTPAAQRTGCSAPARAETQAPTHRCACRNHSHRNHEPGIEFEE
jgi:BON domain